MCEQSSGVLAPFACPPRHPHSFISPNGLHKLLAETKLDFHPRSSGINAPSHIRRCICSDSLPFSPSDRSPSVHQARSSLMNDTEGALTQEEEQQLRVFYIKKIRDIGDHLKYPKAVIVGARSTRSNAMNHPFTFSVDHSHPIFPAILSHKFNDAARSPNIFVRNHSENIFPCWRFIVMGW